MRTKQLGIAAGITCIIIGALGSHFLWKTDCPVPVVQQPAPPPAIIACEDKKYTMPPMGSHVNSLWRVAEHEYGGRGYLWPLIAEVNGIDPETHMVHPGDVLKIPGCLTSLPALPKKVAKVSVNKVEPTHVVVAKAVPVTIEKVEEKRPQAPPPPPNPIAVAVVVTPTAEPVAPPRPAAIVAPPDREPVKAEERRQLTPPPPPVRVAEVPLQLPTPPPLVLDQININKTFVGSAWTAVVMSPVEPGNKVAQFHVDEGVILARKGGFLFEPYVAFNATQDTKKFSWNNKEKAEAGLKLVRPFRMGVITSGVNYALEYRQGVDKKTPAQMKSGVELFNEGWFGWGQPVPSSSKKSHISLPGTVWWSVGNISPFEKGNVIGLARVEQGFTLTKVGRVSVIPVGWAQLGFDSQGKPWNNRSTYGGGLKLSLPGKAGIMSLQGGYECSSTRGGVPSTSGCGPTVKWDFWTGWRKGGK